MIDGEQKLTPFEEQIKQYFPEIWNLHMLGKDFDVGGGGERNIWQLVDELLDMSQKVKTGQITINYSKGHIDNIRVTTDVTAHKSIRTNY